MSIRLATSDDADPLISVLADAFGVGCVADWLVPAPGDRHRIYRAYFDDALTHGLTHGTVYVTDDLAGVAIWYPYLEPQPVPRRRQAVLQRIAGPYAPRFLRLEQAFASRHPTLPHHYLAYVAVAAAQQGKEAGTALLRVHHQQLDQLRMPAYLEATNPRAQRLYRRLGYADRTPLPLPDGPTIQPMWRTPTRPRAVPRFAAHADVN